MALDLHDLLVALAATPAPPAPTSVWLRFRCPACGRASTNADDIAERYCGNCHWWTGDPQRAWERPDLFVAHGVAPPGEPGVIRGLRADQVILDELIG